MYVCNTCVKCVCVCVKRRLSRSIIQPQPTPSRLLPLHAPTNQPGLQPRLHSGRPHDFCGDAPLVRQPTPPPGACLVRASDPTVLKLNTYAFILVCECSAGSEAAPWFFFIIAVPDLVIHHYHHHHYRHRSICTHTHFLAAGAVVGLLPGDLLQERRRRRLLRRR